MARYVVALDEGTTSVRTVLFDEKGTMLSMVQHEFRQIYPQPGYVEQDPMEIYANQYSSLIECIAQNNISPEEIAAIGITNQRETTVVWDKKTGTPVYNAIVWQCRRTAPICDQLVADGYEDYIAETTGLKVDAYFSGTKIKWILDHVEGARERAEKGELLFGTIDTWLVWKLTNGAVHVTDLTNASRTMLFDIEKRQWDPKMLEILDIPAAMLPEVRSSSEIYAYLDLMGTKVPIAGIAGDQQSALFGQACFHRGQMKSTYGTGVFLLANTGEEMVRSQHGLVTTLAATRKGYPVEYALEGSVFVGGAVIQWIRDELMLIHDSKDSEYFATKVEDTAGVYIVPAFSGLGAPYWDMEARGTIVGLTRGSNRNHIIRAALESIAYQTADITRAMEQDLGLKIDYLKVDGGASANAFLMQFQADILETKIFRAQMQEATAFGAAALAGLAVGFFKSRNELEELGKEGKVYVPKMEKEKADQLMAGWHKAIRACRTE